MSRACRIPGTPRRRPPLDALVSVVLAAACEQGCTCEPPDLDLVEQLGSVYQVVVAHDVGCPLCPPQDEPPV